MIVSLDQSLLGQKSPWTNVFLGLMSPWTNVYLDNSVLGLLSLGQTVTWTTAPWTNVSTPKRGLVSLLASRHHAHENFWHQGAMLMSAHGSSWLLISSYDYP